MQDHVRGLIELLGYDPEDQHMKETPRRYAEVLESFRANGGEAEGDEILQAVFDDEHDSLVQVGPITVVSACAHHLLPVTGYAWVGYIPQGHVVGLSKLARIVHHFAHQLTVQERVTQNVVDALEHNLKPLGSMCVIEAMHGCMSLRGVQEAHAVTVTSAVRGVFKDESSAREEFLSLMQNRRTR